MYPVTHLRKVSIKDPDLIVDAEIVRLDRQTPEISFLTRMLNCFHKKETRCAEGSAEEKNNHVNGKEIRTCN